MAFVETFSLFLLHDLPWPEDIDGDIRDVFEELWSKLRHAVLYFMRFEEGQHTDLRIIEAQKQLIDYGKRVEEVRIRYDALQYSWDVEGAVRATCSQVPGAEYHTVL